MKDGMHLEPIGVWLIGIFYLSLIGYFSYVTYNCLTAAALSERADLGSALLASSSTALCVSSLFYLRKLYRDIFAGLTRAKLPDQLVSTSATAIYFLSRPAFAVLIAALFTVLVFAAVKQFSEGHVGVNSDFIFLSAISSFLISIGTGAAVTRVEEMAKSGHSFLRLPM